MQRASFAPAPKAGTSSLSHVKTHANTRSGPPHHRRQHKSKTASAGEQKEPAGSARSRCTRAWQQSWARGPHTADARANFGWRFFLAGTHLGFLEGFFPPTALLAVCFRRPMLQLCLSNKRRAAANLLLLVLPRLVGCRSRWGLTHDQRDVRMCVGRILFVGPLGRAEFVGR